MARYSDYDVSIAAIRKLMAEKGGTLRGYLQSQGKGGEAIYVGDLSELVWLLLRQKGVAVNMNVVGDLVTAIISEYKKEIEDV